MSSIIGRIKTTTAQIVEAAFLRGRNSIAKKIQKESGNEKSSIAIATARPNLLTINSIAKIITRLSALDCGNIIPTTLIL